MPGHETSLPEVLERSSRSGHQASASSDLIRERGQFFPQTHDARELDERQHSSGSEQRLEIGLDRFLPEKLQAYEKAGITVAPVLNHEIMTALELGHRHLRAEAIDTMNAHELRSLFSLVHHWENTNGSHFLTDTEKESLMQLAQAVEQAYSLYKKVGHANDSFLKPLGDATINYLEAWDRYIKKDFGGKLFWSYVENVGPKEDDKPISCLPFEALVLTEQTQENINKASGKAVTSPEKLYEALGLTEEKIHGLKEKLTNYAKEKNLRIYEYKSDSHHGFYIYHPEAVEKVIHKHRSALEKEGGLKTLDAETFVKWLSTTSVPVDTALYTARCDAFGEFSNRYRTDVYNPLREGDAKERLPVTVDSLSAEKLELADYLDNQNKLKTMQRERALLQRSERLISYDRFLPEVQKEGINIAPVQKSEFQDALRLRHKIDQLTHEEQRACFYLIKQGIEKLKGWLLQDNLNDQEHKRLVSAAEEAFDKHTNDEDRQRILKEYFEFCFNAKIPNTEVSSLDIMHVGKDKPLAYEEYAKIERTGKDVTALAQEREEQCLGVLYAKSMSMREPRLYVYDRGEVTKWLQKYHKQLFAEKGWPHEPDEFVRRLSEEQIPPKTARYTAIADLFGDSNNGDRVDIFRDDIDKSEAGEFPVIMREISDGSIKPSHLFEQFHGKAIYNVK